MEKAANPTSAECPASRVVSIHLRGEQIASELLTGSYSFPDRKHPNAIKHEVDSIYTLLTAEGIADYATEERSEAVFQNSVGQSKRYSPDHEVSSDPSVRARELYRSCGVALSEYTQETLIPMYDVEEPTNRYEQLFKLAEVSGKALEASYRSEWSGHLRESNPFDYRLPSDGVSGGIRSLMTVFFEKLLIPNTNDLSQLNYGEVQGSVIPRQMAALAFSQFRLASPTFTIKKQDGELVPPFDVREMCDERKQRSENDSITQRPHHTCPAMRSIDLLFTWHTDLAERCKILLPEAQVAETTVAA